MQLVQCIGGEHVDVESVHPGAVQQGRHMVVPRQPDLSHGKGGVPQIERIQLGQGVAAARTLDADAAARMAQVRHGAHIGAHLAAQQGRVLACLLRHQQPLLGAGAHQQTLRSVQRLPGRSGWRGAQPGRQCLLQPRYATDPGADLHDDGQDAGLQPHADLAGNIRVVSCRVPVEGAARHRHALGGFRHGNVPLRHPGNTGRPRGTGIGGCAPATRQSLPDRHAPGLPPAGPGRSTCPAPCCRWSR